MPFKLVLVRPGEAYSNDAMRALKKGDATVWVDNYLGTPGSDLILNPAGKEQVLAAGEWIRREIGTDFDRYEVSPFMRAKHTALSLYLPGANWIENPLIRETDRGDIDLAWSRKELLTQEKIDQERRSAHPFYYGRVGGESLADAYTRAALWLQSFESSWHGKQVIAVTHGHFMWVARMIIEGWTVAEFLERRKLKNSPEYAIHNAQVIEYLSPSGGATFTKVRSVCPWDLSRSHSEWREIVPTGQTNQDLAAFIEQFGKGPRQS